MKRMRFCKIRELRKMRNKVRLITEKNDQKSKKRKLYNEKYVSVKKNRGTTTICGPREEKRKNE